MRYRLLGMLRVAVVLGVATAATGCSETAPSSTAPTTISALIVPEDCNPCGVGPSQMPAPYAYTTFLAKRVDSLIRVYPKAPPGTKTWDAIIYAVDTARMLEYMSPFRDNIETYSSINAAGYQTPEVNLSVVGASVSFKQYRGVETIYGGNHTVGGPDPEYGAGGDPRLTAGGPPLTCTDLQLAFYDANNRVNNRYDRLGFAAGTAAAGTIAQIARGVYTNGVTGDAAAALTPQALARAGIGGSAAYDTYLADILVAQWSRNILGGLMRVKGCM